MPGEPSELEARLAAVETEVRQLRAALTATTVDAVAARVLAAGADRDVSEVRAELRAHTQALNALRETQTEQGQWLNRLEAKVDTGFAALHANVGRVLRLVELLAGEA